MKNSKKHLSIVNHYLKCFNEHGDTHKGMDWPKLEDVDKRYRVMFELLTYNQNINDNVSILDFGCGTSHFYEYIKKQNVHNVKYYGLEISAKQVELAKFKYPENDYYCMDILQDSSSLGVYDYIVMNGVFTEKIDLSYDEMLDYFKEMLSILFDKANKGVAFNVMSKAVDWEREDLFHLSTDILIKFITEKLSRNFVIRNDYGLYEYTVYIYK